MVFFDCKFLSLDSSPSFEDDDDEDEEIKTLFFIYSFIRYIEWMIEWTNGNGIDNLIWFFDDDDDDDQNLWM